ncbi:MAG: hypothetical protein LQ347_005492 [Umbilicaria vellea]|nr:MAG: hypothetical protein LQ347_005492 [Umbilicaria vellea]
MADPPTSIPFIEPPAPIDDPVPTDDPPTSVPCDEAVLLSNGPAPTIDPGELLVQTIKSLVDGVGSLTTELRSQVSEAQMDGTASSQTVSHALEHGLRSAFKGFASCVQNIAEAVQNASDATQHAADRTRGIDTQILEGAVKGLQGLAGGITAFGRDLVPTETRTVPSRNDAAVSELTAQGRQDAIPSLVTDLPVNLLLPVELVQPSPTMKDGSSAGLVCSGIQRKDEVHEATEGRRYESRRSEQASPVSALSEGLKELSKSGGDQAATEAEKEHQECTACSSLWPDKCYWHESTSLPYKSDTTERGRQSRRSAYRSNPTLTYEYVVPPPAFRAKEHSVLNTQEQDCTPHDSRRSRSRSPPLSSPRRISPTRRSSPSGWPRFHGPGPIHLPQDIPDSIPHRRERRQLWRSRRQHAPRLSDGPLLRRGNDYPAYLSPKPVDFSKAYSHGGDFGSFGSEGRPFQHRTSEQPIRGNLNDGYWLPVGEDRDRPLHQQLRFAPPMYQTRQAGALRHHQSTPTLGRPHGSYEVNKQTLKLPVRTHVGRVDIPSGTGWGRSHRRAVARVVPRRYSSVEDVDSLSEDLKSTLDGDSNGPSRRIASEELNVARPDTNSSPVVTHFPTLEQFEGATFTGQPRFPPLPSMEPLIPSRPENRRDDSQESRRGDYEPVVAKATDPTLSKVYPSAWPHPAGEANPTESSGDFFKRMTGLTESSKTRVPLDTTAPEARLMKPFDPLADTRPLDSLNGTAAPTLSPLRGAVRRVNTVAGTGGRYNPSNHRRPYSEFFSGDGRIGWDTFVRGYERGSSSASAETPEPSSAHPHAQDSEPRPLHPNSVAVDRASEAVFHTHSDPKPAPVKPFTTRARVVETHPDYPAVHKVQQCVDQLTALGFGSEENGGLKRLVVYAQAAEGDLEEAIEMIEEERRAYKERFF